MKKLRYLLMIILIVLSISTVALGVDTPQFIANAVVGKLKSKDYIILEENMVVSRVLPKTTVEEFKNNFYIDGQKIKVYDQTGENEILTGIIGTGMKVTFDGYQGTYTISVMGDLTGDGEISQVEVNKAIKHVIGLKDYQLEGIYKISIDMSGDGTIDQRDVSILIRYVVFGRLELGEPTRPTAPIIEVKDGVEGKNDWYKSNVELRIRKPDTSILPIETMTYEISGAKNQEETIVNDGTRFILEDEGIYTIRAYSIAENGIISSANEKIIRIDKKVPTGATLVAKLENENGDDYQYGTMTDKNVYLTTTGGEDETSGVQEVSIFATGANPVPAGTTQPVVMDNTGSTTVTVTTKDYAGWSVKKSYEIKIDNTIPGSGTVITKLNNKAGELYIQDTWTSSNVYAEISKGAEDVTTTYRIEGANPVKETTDSTTITKEGISTIIVTNKNTKGEMSTHKIIVKIDRSKPKKATLEVTGTKIIKDSIWYTDDLKVRMIAGEDTGPSGVQYVEYELENTQNGITRVENIESGESLRIKEDGIYNLTAYTVDNAGNKSDPVTTTIYFDGTDPVPGSMNLYKNVKNGETYINESWSDQSVYCELLNGTDETSGHESTKYSVSGPSNVRDITIPLTVSKEGTYTITITTKDVAGRTATRVYTINIDKSIPDSASAEIIEGTKDNPRIDWYKTKVKIQVTQGKTDRGGSGVSHTTYEYTGPVTKEATRIEDQGTFELVEDGIYNVTIYTWDVAGNKSKPTNMTVKIDKTAPPEINIQESNVKGRSFDITATTTENVSGVVLYQFYVDGKLYKEIDSNENSVTCSFVDQTSGEHTIKVDITDLAGNVGTNSKLINMGRLDVKDIDYIEFVIESFTLKNGEQVVNTGAEFIKSDTSISKESKYVQVSSSTTNVVGEVKGIIRAVRTDGTYATELEYLPENTVIKIGQSSDGAGSTWNHEATVNVANTELTDSGKTEATEKETTINITEKPRGSSIFSVKDKKTQGTKTWTRLVIKEITVNGEKVQFRVSSNVI